VFIKRLHLLLIIGLCAGCMLGAPITITRAAGQTFAVNTTVDAPDAAPGNGVCETASGNAVCTLRAAIQEANALAGADTITLPAEAFILKIAGSDDTGLVGDLDITDDLTINGVGHALVAGGAGWSDRIFDIRTAGISVTLNNLTIAQGKASGGGGGIANIGNLTVENSIVSGNSSGYAGGGIYQSSGGTLTVKNSAVTDNLAGAGGGISSVNATLIVIGSVIADNSTSNSGGGILSLNSTLTLTNSAVSGNESTGDMGGGISSGDSTLTVTSSTISGNTAHLGGSGIANIGSTLTLSNSTVSGNTTTSGAGGGINNLGANGPYNASTAILKNVTVANNSAPTGGGIANGGTLKLKNTLIADNAGGSAPDCSGTLVSQGYNLIGNSAGCSGATDGVNGDLVGSPASPLDPQLGPLQDNGGATMTQALIGDSPAIDAGDLASCPAHDQRGIARPKGARCDIGAFELEAIVKQGQTIAFAALPNKTIGEPQFAVSATASSGLPVTFTASGQCSITGTVVTLTGTGSCTITAHQAGNAIYNAAPDVAQTFQINASGPAHSSVYLPLLMR
jgi:CSLREA domain-containing protein